MTGARAVVWLCLFAGGFPAAAQTRLSLAEIGARVPPDYMAAHLGETVTAHGVINAPAFHFPEYIVATIEDGGRGGVLEVLPNDGRLDALRPGDEVEAAGTVAMLAGLVVVRTDSLQVVGRQKAPAPVDVRLAQLQNLDWLGCLVRTEGVVKGIGDTTAGETLLINDGATTQRVFVPRGSGRGPVDLAPYYSDGDRVRVTGIAFQYSPRKPHNRDFELLAAGRADIVRIDHTWYPAPAILAGALGVALVAVALFWSREHRLRKQRATLRLTYQLAEDILSSPSPEDASRRIADSLPGILGVTRVRVFIHNRATGTLDESAKDGSVRAIALPASPESAQSGAAACFHYRTRLVVPDTARSPFPMEPGDSGGTPRSQLFVPMLTQGGLVGILELDRDDRGGDFDADEQSLSQHLANQMAVALKLLDQRSVQEQLFRTEKLAAVGRLISGVVNELQTPLASITDLALRAARTVQGAPGKDLAAIASEAEKASGMVARLVSFAAAGPGEARPVSIGALLRTLVDFRERDWKASGIKVRDLLTSDPLMVMGSHGQLEQVFLRLLVHAEQSLAGSSEKVLTVRSSRLARMAVVEIIYSARGESHGVEDLAAMLGLTRSVIAGHGGEVRLIDKGNADARFEVELPILAKERTPVADVTPERVTQSGRRMTALLIEPDDTAQRQILHLLSARGYRVVPVGNTDTGIDLAQRMRFDAVMCSVRAPGLNWVEVAERMQSKVTGFVLLSDGYDAELSANFEGDGRFVLAKPVQEAELNKVLSSLERLIPA